MAATREETFRKTMEEKASDLRHKEILGYNLDNYQAAFERAKAKYFDLNNSKKKAHLIKWKAIDNIERYLLDFESNFIRRGGRVIWANTAEEALEEIDKIISTRQIRSVVKSHAMILEEIDLHRYLTRQGIEPIETDPGRYITLLEKTRPSHPIQAAAHMGFEEVVDLFHQHHQLPKESSPKDILKKTRELLRPEIKQSTVAISDASYLTADTGSVVISENEGHNRLSTAFAKTHIILAGIDKILPSINDLDLFLPLAASHDHGQDMNTFNTIINGPRKETETDGPEDMVVILVDNGRTNLLAQKEQRQGLYWMECGASTNNCALYRNIGGHTYQTTYPGPMGALFTPYLTNDIDGFRYLSHASSFSKKNSIPSPLYIDIPRLLLLNREEYIQHNKVSDRGRKIWNWYSRLAKSRKLLDFFGVTVKNFLLALFLKKQWGKRRTFPKVTEKSFAKQWQAKMKEKD